MKTYSAERARLRAPATTMSRDPPAPRRAARCRLGPRHHARAGPRCHPANSPSAASSRLWSFTEMPSVSGPACGESCLPGRRVLAASVAGSEGVVHPNGGRVFGRAICAESRGLVA
jgi:hypothetical protein